jgi:hypothetical protein
MRVRRDRVAAGRASMQNPERLADAGRFSARDQSTLLASAFYVALVGAAAWITGSQPLAVYALGFWHYYLYGLAYRYGAVPLPVFKRDAVLMKTIALAALASAYLAAPLDYASLAVVAAGFLLNTLAASALGSDRTYYGHEVANLPPLRVTRFPYSVISHPMLLGNMLAYGGTLLNAGFREQWWPLACAHVALNLGLLVMERRVTPLRRAATGTARPPRPWSWPRALWLSAAGAALGIGAAQVAGSPSAPFAAALGATVVIYGYTLYCAYTAPAPPRIDESGSTE